MSRNPTASTSANYYQMDGKMTTLEYSKVFMYLANNNSQGETEISCFQCSLIARPTKEWKGRDL